MFGAIPKQAWSRRYPSGNDNTCLLAMNCLLVWNLDYQRVILLDTGAGNKSLGKLAYYRFHDQKDLPGMIQDQGFNPEQVTDVVLSHLHFDHCGGCTRYDDRGQLQPTFPRARHWVSQQQWDNYLNPNTLEKSSYRTADMQAVHESGLLQLIDEPRHSLAPEFELSTHGGHSVGQLVSKFQTPHGQILFAGDVIPTRAHLSPQWISAYDTHPLEALVAKDALKQAMQERPTRLFFYHDAYYLSI
jgi:glyoxylase-like metal-dependent hydrolase (beta-lactamase superfamily II)